MQAADYRLVRSCINVGIMISIKQSVLPKTVDEYFSYWLYGQRKSTKQFLVYLPRSLPCLICSEEICQTNDISLLTVDFYLFYQCLSLFNNEQLSIVYSLLDHDKQVYQYIIRQQYQNYKQRLRQILKEKFIRQ